MGGRGEGSEEAGEEERKAGSEEGKEGKEGREDNGVHRGREGKGRK